MYCHPAFNNSDLLGTPISIWDMYLIKQYLDHVLIKLTLYVNTTLHGNQMEVICNVIMAGHTKGFDRLPKDKSDRHEVNGTSAFSTLAQHETNYLSNPERNGFVTRISEAMAHVNVAEQV